MLARFVLLNQRLRVGSAGNNVIAAVVGWQRVADGLRLCSRSLYVALRGSAVGHLDTSKAFLSLRTAVRAAQEHLSSKQQTYQDTWRVWRGNNPHDIYHLGPPGGAGGTTGRDATRNKHETQAKQTLHRETSPAAAGRAAGTRTAARVGTLLLHYNFSYITNNTKTRTPSPRLTPSGSPLVPSREEPRPPRRRATRSARSSPRATSQPSPADTRRASPRAIR